MFADTDDAKQLCLRQFNVSLEDVAKYRKGDDVIFTDDMKVNMEELGLLAFQLWQIFLVVFSVSSSASMKESVLSAPAVC